jgi:hypothetical protein
MLENEQLLANGQSYWLLAIGASRCRLGIARTPGWTLLLDDG